MFCRSTAILVLLASLLIAESLPAQDENRRRSRRRPPVEDPGKIEKDADSTQPSLVAGKVPVLEFLRFIEAETGKPTVYPSAPTPETQFGKEVMIDVLSDIAPLTVSMVESLLAVNGYELFEEALEDGSQVIVVRHTQSRNRTTVPETTKIYTLETLPDDESSMRLATLTVKLKNMDTNSAIGALRDLLGVAGRGSSGTVSIINLTRTNTLLIKGKIRILRHIKELITSMDVPSEEAFEVMHVVQVQHTRATIAAGVVEQFLGKHNVRLVAEDRSGKVFIQAKDSAVLDRAKRMISEVDTEEVKYAPPAKAKAPAAK